MMAMPASGRPFGSLWGLLPYAGLVASTALFILAPLLAGRVFHEPSPVSVLRCIALTVSLAAI